MKAYEKATDATADSAGKTIKLSRPSRLMAANVQGSRPWQFLLDSDLPAGTSFTVLESIKGTDGAVEGYLVPAPAQARGYVKSDQVRRATPEEAAAQTPAGNAKSMRVSLMLPSRIRLLRMMRRQRSRSRPQFLLTPLS
jgi:hypothetical protein